MNLCIRKNIALSLFWGLWIGTLVAYFISDSFIFLFIAPTLLLIFIATNIMFKKKITNSSDDLPTANMTGNTAASQPNSLPDNAKKNTIIASGTELKGNIILDGDIQIYGVVVGDIIVNEGTIRLMHSGKINGNLTAPNITIDGQADGVSIADNLEILENGCLNGIAKSRNFSIKKGGVFIGQSEIMKEPAPTRQIMDKSKPATVAKLENIKKADVAVTPIAG